VITPTAARISIMNKVEDIFKQKGILRSNVYMYKKDVAIEYITACKNENIDILGIDAFIIKSNFTQPSMDNSVDFTIKSTIIYASNNVWDNAISFLKERDDVYYFEIVTS
jgi:hypothetical protein